MTKSCLPQGRAGKCGKRSSQQKVLKGRDLFGAVLGQIWADAKAHGLDGEPPFWQFPSLCGSILREAGGERLLETVAWAPVAPFYEMSIKLEKLPRTTISKHCKLTESTQQIEKLLPLKTCWSFGGAQQETVAS